MGSAFPDQFFGFNRKIYNLNNVAIGSPFDYILRRNFSYCYSVIQRNSREYKNVVIFKRSDNKHKPEFYTYEYSPKQIKP